MKAFFSELGFAGPLSSEQREKLVKQKEQYERAAEKLEDQVKLR